MKGRDPGVKLCWVLYGCGRGSQVNPQGRAHCSHISNATVRNAPKISQSAQKKVHVTANQLSSRVLVHIYIQTGKREITQQKKDVFCLIRLSKHTQSKIEANLYVLLLKE